MIRRHRRSVSSVETSCRFSENRPGVHRRVAVVYSSRQVLEHPHKAVAYASSPISVPGQEESGGVRELALGEVVQNQELRGVCPLGCGGATHLGHERPLRRKDREDSSRRGAWHVDADQTPVNGQATSISEGSTERFRMSSRMPQGMSNYNGLTLRRAHPLPPGKDATKSVGESVGEASCGRRRCGSRDLRQFEPQVARLRGVRRRERQRAAECWRQANGASWPR